MDKNSSQNRLYKVSRIFAAVFVSLAWLMAMAPNNASAAIITGRVLTLGSAVGGASTSYTFAFTVPTTGTIVKSVAADICTTAEGTCTMPSDFSNTVSTLSSVSGLGDAGWTINTSTLGSIRIKNTGNTTTPSGSQSIVINSVTNPSTNVDNFFARITTYSDDAWTTAIDTGTVSASVAKQNTVTVDISEVLTFSLGTTTVNLTPPLTADVTGIGTSTLTASTNATNGYSVTVSGNTLESGVNSIAAMNPATTSTQGTAQFGINLKNNATPDVGTEVSGTGTATAAAGYNVIDTFKFLSGDSIAASSGPTNSNTFTVSYIANVALTTAIGDYNTTLTYIVTGNF